LLSSFKDWRFDFPVFYFNKTVIYLFQLPSFSIAIFSNVFLGSTTKERGTKSAANSKISQRERERAKTTSYCTKRANVGPIKGHLQEKNDENKSRNAKTSSVYGKHYQGEETSKPEKWFNFKDGMKIGIIDSFVCDELKKKALCYTLDTKESKPVPKLLRHRLEVRIGQNGEVRNTDAGSKESDPKASSFQRMPLSWEEQLNSENVSLFSNNA
jgi:hypothetical protein